MKLNVDKQATAKSLPLLGLVCFLDHLSDVPARQIPSNAGDYCLLSRTANVSTDMKARQRPKSSRVPEFGITCSCETAFTAMLVCNTTVTLWSLRGSRLQKSFVLMNAAT